MSKERKYPKGLTEKLYELLRKAEETTHVKRIQCILFRIRDGMSPSEIAELVGYHPNYIEQIQARFWKEGEAIFEKKKKGGRYYENMTVEEEAELINNFKEEAGKGNIVEVSKIKEAYDEKLGKKTAESTVYRMLNRHGWRKIAPRPTHPKNDKNAMENFKKTSHG